MTSTPFKHNKFSFLSPTQCLYQIFCMIIHQKENRMEDVMDNSDTTSGPKQNKIKKSTPVKVKNLQNFQCGPGPKLDQASHKTGITKFCSMENKPSNVSKTWIFLFCLVSEGMLVFCRLSRGSILCHFQSICFQLSVARQKIPGSSSLSKT